MPNRCNRKRAQWHTPLSCASRTVIHAVGPGFRTNEEDPVGRLVEVYMGVLQLFVRETRETGANELRLRLLPVSLS